MDSVILHLDFLTWVIVGFLLVFQNAYTVRWGNAYQNKAHTWYTIWQRISFWVRVIPFPVIWYQQGLVLALTYGVIVSVFYSIVENKFLGKSTFKINLPAGSPQYLVGLLFRDALALTLKLSILLLLFLAIIFNW